LPRSPEHAAGSSAEIKEPFMLRKLLTALIVPKLIALVGRRYARRDRTGRPY
jgi:hypothetical protein